MRRLIVLVTACSLLAAWPLPAVAAIPGPPRAAVVGRGIDAPVPSSRSATATMGATPEARRASRSVGGLDDDAVAGLFDAALPGVSAPVQVPPATGDAGADARIAQVAQRRGYRARGVALDPLGSYQGRPLQQRAIADLVALQEAMAADIGTTLTVTSGFRPPSQQRSIFLGRLDAAAQDLRGRSVSVAEIARGDADDVLHAVMATAAPPGFSRHQTGYAIDVAAHGLGLHGFATTDAYRWLRADRYANAMRFGWIPSYPPGAVAQGPDPEPWEWVWIGRAAAGCARAGRCPLGGLKVSGSGSRVRLEAWVDPRSNVANQVRVVTAAGRHRVAPRRVHRVDVEVVAGTTVQGLSMRTRLPSPGAWLCLEVREGPRTKWQRLDCVAR